MSLNTQDFTTLVRNQVSAAQASSTSLLDFTTGSVLLALIEANSSAVALWLQGLAIYDLALTRAATSNGADLDTWMADFGLTRLPASAATGTVTFSRFTSTVQGVVPIGAQLQTTSGVVTYSVTLDTDNPNYNSSLGGYVLTVSTDSIDVPVEANTVGTIGNAATGEINVITTPIPYVDSVTNASSFENGTDQETDAAFRTRFVNYLASLSKATESAIGYAISTVQGVVDYSITENESYAGSTQYGYFYVVADDGTGTPSDELIANVNNAVDAVRGLTIQFGVFKPIVVDADVVMTVTVAPNFDAPTVKQEVEDALRTYIDLLRLGNTLYYTRLFEVAYDASEGVLNVSSVTLNGTTSDVTATAKQMVKADSITVN